MKKILMVLILMLVGSVNANPIAIPTDNVTTPAVGSDHLILLPLTNFNVSVATPANYGLGFEYGIAYANLLPVDTTHINVQPYLCLGVFASANVGDFIKGDGPISVDYGITIGTRVDPTLPMIGVSYVWNTIARGDALEEINASIDTTLLNDILGSVVKIIN